MTQPESIGRYQIKRVLGRGAAGVVYLARDPLIDREVAVKTLRADLDDQVGAEDRERFLREARAAGRLSHPTIVTIYDVGLDDASGRAFIAMEYLEGSTLKDVLAGDVRYDAERAARLGATLAEALGHAHGKGIVHRDVKPANIILTADGKVKITDFGIARLDTSDLTVEGSVIGTPNYMSPEQVRGEPADERSDVYSLGVILFELVTGRRPFSGRSFPELSLNITTQPAPNPTSLCPDLPPSLAAIILRCLAKDPESRFPSCAGLAESLRDLAGARQPDRIEPPAAVPLPEIVDAGPEESAPQPTDLVATRLRGADTVTVGRDAVRWWRRGSAAAARIASARWFRPAAAAVVLLAVVAVALHTMGRVDDSAPSSMPALASGAAAPVAGAAPESAPANLESTLVLTHKNRLSLAFISLWVDGSRTWSERMTADKNLLKRVKRIPGVQVRQSIPISAGPHEIEVHISGASREVEARASIRGTFTAGEARYLKVILNPFTKKLRLEWGGP